MKFRYQILLIAIIATIVLLAGCATIEGAGEDIETVGEEIQETANDN